VTHAHNEASPHTNLEGAHGFVFHVENLGKGVAAVLIGGIILAALLSGMALMRTEAVAEQARYTERETKLLREDVRVMSIALARHGINTDEHAVETGESK
jgi:hypothetical protein